MDSVIHGKYRVDSEELKNQMLLAKQTGVVSDRLASLWLTIIKKQLNSPNFKYYELHLKQDMTARAFEKLMGCPRTFRDSFMPYSAQNYLKLVIWRAFLDVIKAEYKQRNIRRELTLKALADNPNLDDIDRKYLAEYAGLKCGFCRNSQESGE